MTDRIHPFALGLASLALPGSGQALQRRYARGAALLALAAVLWWCLRLGYVVHLWAALDAALARRTS
ncbi:MAG: hypothetical protein R3F34_09490 [Planctomycetota bacterium]